MNITFCLIALHSIVSLKPKNKLNSCCSSFKDLPSFLLQHKKPFSSNTPKCQPGQQVHRRFQILAPDLWSIQGMSCNQRLSQIDRICTLAISCLTRGTLPHSPGISSSAKKDTKASTLNQDLKAHPRTGIQYTQSHSLNTREWHVFLSYNCICVQATLNLYNQATCPNKCIDLARVLSGFGLEC